MRLNILFSIVIVLFGALVYRLVDLQFQNKTKYETLLGQTSAIRVKTDATRGQIYDRNGVLLVGNASYKTIDYTRYHTKTADMIHLAKQVSELIHVPIDKVTTEQLKIYFIANHPEEIARRLGNTKLEGVALVQAQMDVVSDAEINYSDVEKEVAIIYNRMNAVSYLGTTSLKNRDVTDAEIANVTELLGSTSGISIGSDWERVYPQGDLLRAILGSVSSQQAGLPSEQQGALLAQGYQQNSRVGTSYLEQQYDSVLRGTPKVVATTLNSSNDVVSSQVEYEGKAGDNIYLTVDSELQKRVDTVLTNFLAQTPLNSSDINDSVYAVIQQVDTGDILAISGKRYEYNEETDSYNRAVIEDATLNVFSANYTMGSVVKPATVTAGYQYGVISEDNNILIDEPITFDGGRTSISSVFNRDGRVTLTDETALGQSSNAYMVKLAMLIGGQSYEDNMVLNIDLDTQDKLRKTFASYGLGAYTGVDLPSESKGYLPDTGQMSHILMNSFGQFDTYTTLQVSQYMNTIANGGFRYAPRLVNTIRTAPTTNNLAGIQSTDMAPKLLNQVPITDGQMKRIHNGLYHVTHTFTGTAYSAFANYGINVLGKTGTAEAAYNGQLKAHYGQPVETSTFASFAPADDPKISVTVVIPNLRSEQLNSLNASALARSIYQAYFGQ